MSNLLGYWDHFSTSVLKQYLPDRTCLINTEYTKFNKQRESLIWVSNTKWPWLFCFKIFSSSVKNAPVNLLWHHLSFYFFSALNCPARFICCCIRFPCLPVLGSSNAIRSFQCKAQTWILNGHLLLRLHTCLQDDYTISFSERDPCTCFTQNCLWIIHSLPSSCRVYSWTLYVVPPGLLYHLPLFFYFHLLMF